MNNRPKHTAISRTQPKTWEGKGMVHQIKWDDGNISSLYDYQDGTSTHLHVVFASYYESEFSPIWIPEEKWRRMNTSYHDRLLLGRSYSTRN